MLRRTIAGFLSSTHSLSMISRSCCWYRMTSSPTRVVVLEGIAPTLWRIASQPISLAALVEAAVAVHGEPVGRSTRLRSWPNPLPISARPGCWSWTSPFRDQDRGPHPAQAFVDIVDEWFYVGSGHRPAGE